MGEKEIGIETTSAIVSFAVNLAESINDADLNGDGKVSANEALGIATNNGLQLFSLLKETPQALEEIKDLDTDEIKKLVHLAVDEIDNLSNRKKNWVKNTANSSMNLVRLAMIAPGVWKSEL